MKKKSEIKKQKVNVIKTYSEKKSKEENKLINLLNKKENEIKNLRSAIINIKRATTTPIKSNQLLVQVKTISRSINNNNNKITKRSDFVRAKTKTNNNFNNNVRSMDNLLKSIIKLF